VCELAAGSIDVRRASRRGAAVFNGVGVAHSAGVRSWRGAGETIKRDRGASAYILEAPAGPAAVGQLLIRP
jgi:hypothetical protein